MSDRAWHDTASAAEYTGYSVGTIRKALASGRLKGFQPGRKCDWRITSADLDRWVMGEQPTPLRSAS